MFPFYFSYAKVQDDEPFEIHSGTDSSESGSDSDSESDDSENERERKLFQLQEQLRQVQEQMKVSIFYFIIYISYIQKILIPPSSLV